MSHPAIQIKDETTTDIALARIDSIDEASRDIVRKFLRSHGCEVEESQIVSQELTYHIVIGDPNYVRGILATDRSTSHRLFLILCNATQNDIDHFQTVGPSKIWLTKHIPLKALEMDVLFAYLFTGTEHVSGTPILSIHEIIHIQKQVYAKPQIEQEWEKRKDTLRTLLKTQEPVSFLKSVAKNNTNVNHRYIFFPIIIAIFIPLWYVVSFGLIVGLLLLGGKSLARGHSTEALRFSQASKLFIVQNQMFTRVASSVLGSVGFGAITRGQERMLTFFTEIAESEKAGSQLIQDGKELTVLLFAKDENHTNSSALALERLKQRVGRVYTNVNLASSELQVLLSEHQFPLNIAKVQTLFQKYERQILSGRQALESAHKLLDLFPVMAGFKQKKTYLVLLQNSAELRPTGGFIGSIALASLEEGKLADLSVQDVYTVDGQLKGHIDPPLPIREQLGQEHWYLRDSNWDPDFSVSGPRAAWFYQKETGTSVDGVIAINSPFIVDVLRATGPIQMSDYNDTITADNFYAKSLFYTQADFFPGSTQKKDFLGSLLTNLISRITTYDSVSMPALLRAVTLALGRGDILFSFTDAQTEELVKYFGWGGSPSLSRACTGIEKACVSDGIFVVDANLGVNKVNYFISRKQEHRVTIGEDGNITEETSSSYHNSSRSDVYKNYARFYIPPDAVVSSVMVGGVAIPLRDPQNTKIPNLPFAEVDTSTRYWLIVGVAFTVEPSEDTRIAIAYTRREVFPVESDVTRFYFTNIMQPGIGQNQFSFVLSYPLAWTIHGASGTGWTVPIAKEGRVQYNDTIAKTQPLSVSFSKE